MVNKFFKVNCTGIAMTYAVTFGQKVSECMRKGSTGYTNGKTTVTNLVKEMLERLHNQPHGKRLWIETFSRATGKVIRPGEVLDWEGES